MDSRIEAFLRERTTDVRHTGRTFFEHLVGVHDLLRRYQAPDHVCMAGLFHSIYGTNIFRHRTVSARDEIIELIGPQAERLAFIFCSCNRPRELINAASRGHPYYVRNRHDETLITLSREDMRDLLNIELANLLDQGGGPLFPQVLAARFSLPVAEASDA
jgi:hypothetical protein